MIQKIIKNLSNSYYNLDIINSIINNKFKKKIIIKYNKNNKSLNMFIEIKDNTITKEILAKLLIILY